MPPFISTIRVGYSDTDQMGFVHHSNYLKYYETARWNLFRHLGIPYKEVEKAGMLLPVVNVQIDYLKPAFYDEELIIETSVAEVKGARILLNYKLLNAKGELINTATITLAFINVLSKKPCKPSRFIQKLLQQNIQEERTERSFIAV
jgi:acyl-CoA thioester hydrolase